MSKPVKSMAALVAQLPHIARLHIEARPGPGSRSHWTGEGNATVDVRREDNGDWLFRESGRIKLNPHPSDKKPGSVVKRSLAFRNVLRWRMEEAGIELAHQRLGAGHEVELVRLIAQADGAEADLVSARPHQCGEDRYNARLFLVSEGFDLHWHVEGPDKDEWLVHRYRSG